MLTCFDSSPEIYVVAALVTDIQKYVLKQQPLQKKKQKTLSVWRAHESISTTCRDPGCWKGAKMTSMGEQGS